MILLIVGLGMLLSGMLLGVLLSGMLLSGMLLHLLHLLSELNVCV